MADYSCMYRKFLDAQDNAIKEMNYIIKELINAHRQAEEIYISAEKPRIAILDNYRNNDNGQIKE